MTHGHEKTGLRHWDRLRVQPKVWIILLVVFLPLVAALLLHVTLIDRLQRVQRDLHHTVLAREQLHVLSRLAVDIEDAFRGYVLTQQEKFLVPLEEAESRLPQVSQRAMELAAGVPGLPGEIHGVVTELKRLLASKHDLIRRIQAGNLEGVATYVRSGRGIELSYALRQHLRNLERRLDERVQGFEGDEGELTSLAYWGLLIAVVGAVGLGLAGARWFSRSLTGPLERLQRAVDGLAGRAEAAKTPRIDAVDSSDEIGQLARSCEDMALRIRQQFRELEALTAIGNEINTIGADGLEGVLRRITDRAADLLQVDVCLVMLRDERMGAWVVEAASGEWNDRLKKSVMLWEEFPVSVRAFETKQPSFGEDLHSDLRPEVSRRNLMGRSMLSVPLLSQGEPFGVLILLQGRMVSREAWNLRLATGFAAEAALAIANARLYEASQQKEKGLELRLKQLEHLAETLAHDLKAPGERMEGLSSLLLAEYEGRLDDRATRWLRLIEENGKELIERVENILTVARVGTRQEAIEAVDPGLILQEVLNAWAGELESRKIKVQVDQAFPVVAGHRAYLRQVFDNLLSNAIKFTADQQAPEVRITSARKGAEVWFSVSDNGCGIPPEQREQVFEPFVRLQPQMAKGSGIGLPIVKRIVELYRGRVWIEPQGPPGCTVTFVMPALGGFPLKDARENGSGRPVQEVGTQSPLA